MIIGYCRVFAWERSRALGAQRERLAAAGAQRFVEERVGWGAAAPELERAIAAAEPGDTLLVTRPYRLARSTRGVMTLIGQLGRRGVGVRILGTPVDTGTVTGRMILGSTPLWSLGVSPLRAALRDVLPGQAKA